MQALADATFEAREGEILTLLGPSGSGKTTVLRIIAGLETADAGTVEIEGSDKPALMATWLTLQVLGGQD